MDVLAAVQEHDTLSESVLALCNALAVGLKADRVSLGLVRKDAVKLAAMSHGAWFRKRSDVAEALEAAMDEATDQGRSEEHTSELQSLMRISYAVFCLKKTFFSFFFFFF